MKNFKHALCLFLVLIMSFTALAACNKGSEDNSSNATSKTEEINPTNEEKALVLQENTFDGIFNPFFYSSAYDKEVISLINVTLLGSDVSGAIVAGDDYPTVAKSYNIYFTDKDGVKKDTYPKDGLVMYEMVLKNNMKFSDGTPITAEDVLFNLYVFFDPAYAGSDTLYTLPVQGMQDYKLQAANSATYIAKANDILAAGKSHVWTSSDPWSKDEQDFYWKSIATCGTKFAQTIIDYIMKNYGDDKNVAAGIDSATTGEMLKKSKALTTAYGMAMWGFGGFTYNYVEAADGKYVGVKNADGTFTAKSSLASALKNPDFSDIVKAADGKYVLVDGKYVDYADSMGKDVERYSSTLKTGNVILNKTTYNGFKDATGKAYTLKGEDYPTAETYFSVMCAAYADENGNTDYKTLADTEKTESGYSFITAAGEEFAK
ncbi:MAG: ABC transporter substrate-binding protein, partial [Clostridia bacterium]